MLKTDEVPAQQTGTPEQSQDGNSIADDTKNPAELAQRFHALFRGNERAHGTYCNIQYDRQRDDGKVKGEAKTVWEPATVALWASHLAGESGLGVIPILDDDSCLWGAIDVDVYADMDHGRIASTVKRLGLPLITCRSKSGGCHLLLFSQSPVPAADMQKRLQEIAAHLGFGTSELYPKQTTIRDKQRDAGSWLNMPFFDAAQTVRYAVRPNGDAMSAVEFLDAAEAARQPAVWFRESLPLGQGHLPDGPPCLQHLMEMGFPPGTWNSGMFNLGVYCRKAHPDDWKGHLIQLNAVNFPPDKWPASDLDPIIRSLSKKDYRYQCDKHPLLEHCNKAVCKRRKFGVGTASMLPVLSGLTKLCTDPPVWFLEVEGVRIELTTSELLNPLAFQEVAANHDLIVPVMSRAAWTDYLRPLMATVNHVPVADDGSGADDSSPKAQFVELLESFCTDRAQAHSLDEIRQGRPFSEGGVTHFRLVDFMGFMNRKGVKNFRRHQAIVILKSLGATNHQQRIGSRVPRLWSVQGFSRDDKPLPLSDEIKGLRSF